VKKSALRRRRARGAYQAKHIILAPVRAARAAWAQADKKLVWTYFEAMVPERMPKSLLVVGSGAIGIEFASFFHHGRRRYRGRGAAADPLPSGTLKSPVARKQFEKGD
jgi:hypothetical protein